MIEAVFLDTSPLGTASKRPKQSLEVEQCQAWVRSLLDAGIRVIVPEIADYEVRRELVRLAKRSNNRDSVDRLDNFLTTVEYLPVDTETLRDAAELWAESRNQGFVTADKHALDGDVILCAQVLRYPIAASNIVVATSNVRHLEHFVTAALWKSIVP